MNIKPPPGLASRPPTTDNDGHLTSPEPLDRFAPAYVPLWLRQVNLAPPHFIFPRSPAEAPTFDWKSFAENLFPKSHVERCFANEHATRKRVAKTSLNVENEVPAIALPPGLPSARIIPQKPGTQKGTLTSISGPTSPPPVAPLLAPTRKDPLEGLQPLSSETYAAHWVSIQQVERLARVKQLESATLYAVRMYPKSLDGPTNRHTPIGPALYSLPAKSVREGWPPVDLGDKLLLRQVLENQSWQGFLFEATVEGLNRAAGELLIRCDSLRGREISMIFNVQWQVQDQNFYKWRRCTETLDASLHAESLSRPCSAAWLFPSEEDLDSKPVVPPRIDWVDPALNEEQKNAVKSIVSAQHKIPFLISGPPGTGKTKTLVEAVLQILKHDPTTHILVCGASGPSADTLAMRLAKELTPTELFRLNDPSRPFTEVRGELLPFCHIENEKFALPFISTLLAKRVIVCSCIDASLLLLGRCTNHDLSSLELFIHGSIHPGVPLPLPDPHFGHLLIDEAAQATEPDLTCALSVVVSDDSNCRRAHLGPQIISEDCRRVDLDVSLLERLSERSVYRDHPCARRNIRSSRGAGSWQFGTPFVDLTKNYRSATPILMLPSTLFYHDTLEPYAPEITQKSPLLQWSGLPQPGFPILFHGLCSPDEPVDEGASFFNEGEVNWVRDTVANLVGTRGVPGPHGLLQPKEISVISPFREQVWRIRLALRAIGLSDVDVGNVEALQGAENRVVIISTVRSTHRWLKLDQVQSRGLIHEPKRWNVAMTRAKELLIVIGNPLLLSEDRNWLTFYHFCDRFGCYEGPKIEGKDETAGAEAVSRLEQSWKEGTLGEDQLFDQLVGSIARETLDEDEE